MRLSAKQKKIIHDTVRAQFGEDAQVFLFGSRVDDTKRGGDIDLLVKTSLEAESAFDAKISTLVRIKRLLGDQRIDLVVTSTQETDDRLVVAEAFNHGQLL